MRLVTEGQYSFIVAKDANKKEIADAVKRTFGVDAVSIHTIIRHGKVRKDLKRRKVSRTSPTKHAVIKLKNGQRIDGFDKVLEVADGN
ncbi:50S ribosomal protein L23 [candidate division WWE3 bacterium]|nr:50S ribosomal protein L23 [candidate division WWE3 bacterium]